MEAIRQVSARLDPLPVTPEQTPSPNPTPIPTPGIKLLKAKVERGRAMFVFVAKGSSIEFRCALAKIRQELRYKRCASPATYRNLHPGRYVFKVKALGPDGAETTPVTRHFRVRK
jgi:hypothetical protein